MKCSIIIRSYNEELHIGKLLDGIKHQVLENDLTVEVILVDSGSTDNTVKIAVQKGAKLVEIPKESFSFGRALNLGCKSATGDVLLFASAHVYPVYDDWISRMVLPFLQQPSLALIYGRQIGNNNTHFSEHQVFKKWFPEKSIISQTTPFCNNANCSIRKEVWQKYEYNESLTGLEDLDWANRIMQANLQINYDAQATVVHVHDETPQKVKNRYFREAIALKKIMPKVHVGFIGFLRLFFTNVVRDLVAALNQKLFFQEAKNIVIFRYMQFYGTYLGHSMHGGLTDELKNRFYYPNTTFSRKEIVNNQSSTAKKIDYT